MLSETFGMKDLSEASFVFGMKFIETCLVVYWVIVKGPYILCLKDLIWKAAHLVMLLLLQEIDSLNLNAHRMILNEQL